MLVSLSNAQREIQSHFTELLNDELIPGIRGMGEMPRSADADEVSDHTAARAAVWRALVELGATRLLLPRELGGGEYGQEGAVILAELLGAALYTGPLLDTMIAAELLVNSGDCERARIAEIAEGAAVCVAARESDADSYAHPGPFKVSGDGEGVSATRRFAGFVPDSRYLLVAGNGQSGYRAALIRRDDPAVSSRRMHETARGELYAISLSSAPVLSWLDERSGCCTSWSQTITNARIRQAAYLVGLCQGALDLTVARVTHRRQFGQVLGRFQVPAFRVAELTARLDAARWLVRATAWEADNGHDTRLHAAQVLAMAADLTAVTARATVQYHGAYGTTLESDIRLYFLRAQIERVWLGAPRDLRKEVVPLLAEARANHDRLT
jgi:alkylation response protein AidB-like acyl-CoA dehydrogenase